MDPLFLLAILIFGTFAGLFGAMLGLGGGIFMIIFFMLVLNIPAHNAVALSLLVVIASSSMAGSVYIKDKMTNLKLAMVLETFTVTGAVSGAFVALILPVSVIEIVLGIILVYSSIIMYIGRKSENIIQTAQGATVKGEYYDACTNSRIGYCAVRLKTGFIMSLVGGAVSGIVGIGGGVILVPIMNMVMKIPSKVAAATSNFMVGVTAAASSFVFFNRGYVDFYAAVPTVIGIMIGAYIGTRLIGKVDSTTFRKLLSFVLIFASILLILKAGGFLAW